MDFLFFFVGDSQASPHLQLPHRDLLDLGVLDGVPPSQHVDLGVDVQQAVRVLGGQDPPDRQERDLPLHHRHGQQTLQPVLQTHGGKTKERGQGP